MVRGNWQQRVEKAQARKDATKLRKQKKDQKETSRSHVYKFLAILDRIPAESVDTVHLWTELPSHHAAATTTTTTTTEASPGGKKRGNHKVHPRSRSNSIPDYASPGGSSIHNGGGRRNRSNSMGNGNDDSGSGSVDPRTRDHFFFGTGGGSGGGFVGGVGGGSGKKRGASKKGRNHNEDDVADVTSETLALTLFDAFFSSSSKMDNGTTKTEILEEVATAAPDPLPYLCYGSVPQLPSSSTTSSASLSERVVSFLQSRQCGIATLVYVVLDGNLVFDKYRGGIVVQRIGNVVTEKNGIILPSSPGAGSDGRAIHENGAQSPEESEPSPHQRRGGGGRTYGTPDAKRDDTNTFPRPLRNLWSHGLPAIVLDHVATFLPDASMAVLPQVCRQWRSELGTSSPHLWEALLQRNGWHFHPPWTTTTDTNANNVFATRRSMSDDFYEKFEDDDNSDTQTQRLFSDTARSMVLSHGRMVRDVRAVACGLWALTSSTRHRPMPSVPSTLSHYNRPMIAPTAMKQETTSDNNSSSSSNSSVVCVGLRTMDHRILGAFADGSLRLYEATSTPHRNPPTSLTVHESMRHHPSKSNPWLWCRKAVGVQMFPKTIKRSRLTMVAMDADDVFVGCLVDVAASSSSVEEGAAIVDTLLCVISKEDLLCATDEDDYDRQTVHVGHVVWERFQQRRGQNGNEHDDRRGQVRVGPGLVACGGGTFCIHVTIELMEDDIVVPYREPRVAAVFQRLCLYSAVHDEVLWVRGVSVDDDDDDLWSMAPPTDVSLATLNEDRGSGRRTRRRPTLVSVLRAAPQIYVWRDEGDDDDFGRGGFGKLVANSDLCWVDMQSERWQPYNRFGRASCVLSSHTVVVGDVFRRFYGNGDDNNADGGRDVEVRSVLSTYPLTASDDRHPTSLVMDGNLELLKMEPVDDTYLVVLCFTVAVGNAGAGDGDGDNRNRNGTANGEDIQGEWFGLGNNDGDGDGDGDGEHLGHDAAANSSGDDGRLVACVIYLPTCEEIRRVDWGSARDFHATSPMHLVGNGIAQLGVYASWHGIVVVGNDMTDLVTSQHPHGHGHGGQPQSSAQTQPSPSTQNKKQAKKIKTKKKDGFARGMSLRG